jgi:SNF2 family DNA or RNA helicase
MSSPIVDNVYSRQVEAGIVKFQKWLDLAKLDKKEYQEDGLRFALQREFDPEPLRGCNGGIVADEMGLGKTILSLGLMISHPVAHTLIVVPRALLDQWETELMRLLGHSPLVFHGSRKFHKKLAESPVVLTTYGTIASGKGINPITEFRWTRVIYDEAHRLRNTGTAKHRAAVSLKSIYTWCLTGTPIQNKLRDLVSLCKVMKVSNADKLTNHDLDWIINKFVIKRTKKQVGIDILPVHSENIGVEWETEEEANMAYDFHALLPFTGVTLANVNWLIMMLGSSTLPCLVRMRQMCLLPATMKKAFHRFIDDGVLDADDAIEGINGQSKINAVVKKIGENSTNGKKKLIFTHFRLEALTLKAKLAEMGMKVEIFDGSTSQSQREYLTTTHDLDVLILQINSACEGLNLQHYTEVYFTSPHWNPSVEDQAIGRAHRIGQKDQVKVYRFIMEGFGAETKSIEQYIIAIQDMKRQLMKIFDN